MRLVRCFRQFRKGLRRLVRCPTVPRDGRRVQCLGQLRKHFHQPLVVALGPEKALRCQGMHFRREHQFARRVPELVGLIQRLFPKLSGPLVGHARHFFWKMRIGTVLFPLSLGRILHFALFLPLVLGLVVRIHLPFPTFVKAHWPVVGLRPQPALPSSLPVGPPWLLGLLGGHRFEQFGFRALAKLAVRPVRPVVRQKPLPAPIGQPAGWLVPLLGLLVRPSLRRPSPIPPPVAPAAALLARPSRPAQPGLLPFRGSAWKHSRPIGRLRPNWPLPREEARQDPVRFGPVRRWLLQALLPPSLLRQYRAALLWIR